MLAPARTAHRAPGRMKHIPHLDEVWLERIEHSDPAGRRERQSIVERARNLPALDRADRAGMQFGHRAGHQY